MSAFYIGNGGFFLFHIILALADYYKEKLLQIIQIHSDAFMIMVLMLGKCLCRFAVYIVKFKIS